MGSLSFVSFASCPLCNAFPIFRSLCLSYRSGMSQNCHKISIGNNFQEKKLKMCHADVSKYIRGLKKKKYACVITSSQLPPQVSHPLLPQPPRRQDQRAVPCWKQGKHVLTAMQTLSGSEPGKADSALAWVSTKDAGKDAEAPAAGGQGCPVRAVRSARAQ